MSPFPEARFIETNGIRMAVYEQGEEGGGPPVVLCHGWPELAYSWRHQLPALAEAGYRVIVPDMRGYGRTERPEAIGDYDIHHLTGDMVGLLDALGIERAVFCGHDWGGIVTWAMPLLQPDRVLGVIGVNTPFMPRPPIEPLGFMRQAFGEEMYMVVFQQPGRAETILEADVEKSLRFLFRKVRLPAELLDSTEGRKQTAEQVAYYMANAAQLREGLGAAGFKLFGGEHAPYIWMQTPAGLSSWDCFDRLLNDANVVATPGSGFGASGEGYIRISAFNSRENVEEAVVRIRDTFAG